MNRERIYQALSKGGRQFRLGFPWQPLRPQFDLHLFEQLPSTNRHLWGMVDQGAGAGTVVVAESQSAGQGQRGKSWQSSPGGLYLSLLLEPDWSAANAAQLTFCSGWGVAIAMNQLGIPVQIKWPNDLVIRGKKLGGILTETRIVGHQISHAVIGIGINWQNSVPDTGIALSEWIPQLSGRAITFLEDLVALVLLSVWQGICYRQRVGSKDFMKHYQRSLIHLGKFVSWKGNPAQVIGVTEAGHLQVQLPAQRSSPMINQRVAIPPGEISLGYNSSELNRLV